MRALPSGIAVAMLLAAAASAAAQDRVIGLLGLPEVFGNGPCHAFEPSPIGLHASPGSATTIGTIEVDQHWAFAPHGGCEGLRVSVHRDSARAELPTREYANESPAAIVLAAQDGWFKIRLTDGEAWLHASGRDRFMPLADLFTEYVSLTAVTDAFHGPLLDAPDGAVAGTASTVPAGTPVRVLEVRPRGAEVWLHVAVMSHSICDAERGPPEVVTLGWLPAHAGSGEPIVWFASRGC